MAVGRFWMERITFLSWFGNHSTLSLPEIWLEIAGKSPPTKRLLRKPNDQLDLTFFFGCPGTTTKFWRSFWTERITFPSSIIAEDQLLTGRITFPSSIIKNQFDGPDKSIHPRWENRQGEAGYKSSPDIGWISRNFHHHAGPQEVHQHLWEAL